jgi:recombinational DNA repair protein (RecF pathway)
MPLADRPDFQAWLARFEERYEALRGEGLQPPGNRCDGCGLPLTERVSSTNLCLVCLAETYGRERAYAAAQIAGALETALARDGGETPISDVREAVEEILDRHEEADEL